MVLDKLKGVRLLQAPNNLANQAWLLSQLLKSVGIDSTVVSYIKNYLGYESDINFGVDLETTSFIKKAMTVAKKFPGLLQYDLYHLHSNTLIPYINIDLPILKMLNKPCLINLHGTDARIISIAKKNNPYVEGVLINRDKKATGFLKRCSTFYDTVVVGDYELEEYAKVYFKNATVIPRLINYSTIEPKYSISVKGKLKILHTPTNERVKGTKIIEKAMSKYKRYVEYTKIINTSHKNTLMAIANCDIYLDQIIIGMYGVGSLEAMVLGKPVICYIRPDLKYKFYKNLPIITANPDTLDKTIKHLIKNRDMLAFIGKESRKYVEKYHNTEKILGDYVSLYNSLLSK